MSKKKGAKKAAKKPEPEVEEVPVKSTMEIIFESYLSSKSLAVSQQKSIVSALRLTDSSLYDSLTINIITDFLRFAKAEGLTPAQTDPIYHILQNLIYKIQNNKDFDAEQSSAYFAHEIAKRVRPEVDTATNTENVDESNDAETPNENQPPSTLPSDLITKEHSESIMSFLQKRLLSQYTLYRTALFAKNPLSSKYAEFRKQFKVGDIVRFHDEECLFEIDGFGDHEITIKCLKDGFKSISNGNDNDNDKEEDRNHEFAVKYTMSTAQCHSISFVSRPEKEKSEAAAASITEKDNAVVVDEENLKKEEVVMEEDGNGGVVEEEQQKEAPIVREEDGKEFEKEVGPRTLIDELVDRKVEERLMSMKHQFDAELREYRQQIANLEKAAE